MYDLVVIGAGPAGSSAARAAARLGLDVLVLDKSRFPRHKPCGGALSETGRSVLDFSVPDEVIDQEVSGVRVHFREKLVEVRKKHRLSTLVTRSRFDQLLLDKARDAGAMAVLGQKALQIKEDKSHVRILTDTGHDYRSRLVVIAEGSHGRLSRSFSREERATLGVCMVSEVPVAESSPDLSDESSTSFLEIHFGLARMGYGWVFPHGSYRSVGIGGLAQNLNDPRRRMEEFLATVGLGGRYSVQGHSIPLGGVRQRISQGRTMLCGDAAGFVDPFTGEGISYAVRSGQIAAAVGADHISDGTALLRYDHRCMQEFGSDLGISLYFARIVHRFPDLLFGIFMSDQELVEKYIDIVAMKSCYKDYILWLLPRLPGRIAARMLKGDA